jgi:hypothetical protein
VRHVCSSGASLRDLPVSVKDGAHIIADLPLNDEFDVYESKGATWVRGVSKTLNKTGWALTQSVKIMCS